MTTPDTSTLTLHTDRLAGDYVRRAMRAEDDALTAALVRAAAAGCGVKLTRSSAYALDAGPYSVTTTLTIEVCPDVPAGEIHEHRADWS